jgi:hypothetical protein
MIMPFLQQAFDAYEDGSEGIHSRPKHLPKEESVMTELTLTDAEIETGGFAVMEAEEASDDSDGDDSDGTDGDSDGTDGDSDGTDGDSDGTDGDSDGTDGSDTDGTDSDADGEDAG